MTSILGFFGVLSPKIPPKILGIFWGRGWLQFRGILGFYPQKSPKRNWGNFRDGVGTKFGDFWEFFPPKNWNFGDSPKISMLGFFSFCKNYEPHMPLRKWTKEYRIQLLFFQFLHLDPATFWKVQGGTSYQSLQFTMVFHYLLIFGPFFQ